MGRVHRLAAGSEGRRVTEDKDLQERMDQAARRGLALMEFTLWAFSADPYEINVGERPIGDNKGKVRGFQKAIGAAKQVLLDDPGYHHVTIVPTMEVGGMRPFKVERTASPLQMPERLDPHLGEDRDPWAKS